MSVSLIRFTLRREIFTRFRYSILIVLSIAFGIGSVIGIHSYKENTQVAIQTEARSIMGADVTLQSPQEIQPSARELVKSSIPSSAEISESIQFLSMISDSKGDESSLSFVKAMQRNYPFFGNLVTEPVDAYRNLRKSEILLDESLMQNLQVKLGDSIRLGDTSFRVSGKIIKEPGAVGSFVGSAPSAIVRWEDIPSTGLIQRGSRIRYSIYLKFPSGFDTVRWKDTNFVKFIQEDLTIYHNTEVNSGSQQFIKNTFDYMALLALAGFFLGSLSVFTAVRTRIQEKRRDISILVCLGAQPNRILLLVFLEILFLCLVGTIIGLGLGLFVQSLLPNLTGLLNVATGVVGISFSSLLWSLILGIALPLIISLPLVYQVRHVKPLAALKEVESDEKVLGEAWQWLSFGSIFLIFIILAILETESILKGTVFALVLLSLPTLVYVLYIIIGILLTKLGSRGFLSKEWSLVSKKISRKSGSIRISILGLGSALFILLLSLVLQESLLQLSGARELERRPNLFLLDIRDSQREGVLKIISGFPVLKSYEAPIIGARLSAVNGEPIRKEDTIQNALERNWRATARTREYFLSYRDQLYETEEVTDGTWWSANSKDEISVERDFAGYLKAGLGDTLTFNVQGREISGKITNLRSVNWSDMKPNFVVLFSRGILEKAPRFYIHSLLVEGSKDRYQLQKALVKAYPNVTVIDTEKTIQSFMGILNQVTKMMSLMTMFIFLASMLLVFTTLYASQSERKKEFALFRTIGANTKFMTKHFLREAALVAFVSYSIALAYTILSNEILSVSILEIRSVYPWVIIFGVGCSVLIGTMILYTLGILQLLRLSSKQLLKELK